MILCIIGCLLVIFRVFCDINKWENYMTATYYINTRVSSSCSFIWCTHWPWRIMQFLFWVLKFLWYPNVYTPWVCVYTPWVCVHTPPPIWAIIFGIYRELLCINIRPKKQDNFHFLTWRSSTSPRVGILHYQPINKSM